MTNLKAILHQINIELYALEVERKRIEALTALGTLNGAGSGSGGKRGMSPQIACTSLSLGRNSDRLYGKRAHNHHKAA